MPKLFPQARKAASFLSAADPRLKRLIEKVGPMRVDLDLEETVFESLAGAVVYQQLHGKAAATILGRFKKIYSLEEGFFPSPAEVLATDPALLRQCGLSGAKAAAILDLARHVSEGKIPERAQANTLTDAELIEALTRVKGIGRWTVEMFLIFTLGRTDVLPVHDYGVRNGFATVYGKREHPTPKALEKFGERWKPYRSTAAWYFWRALELPEYQRKKAGKKAGKKKVAK